MKIYLRKVSEMNEHKNYMIYFNGVIYGTVREIDAGWICGFSIVGSDKNLDVEEKTFDTFDEARKFGRKKVMEFKGV